MEIEDQEQEIMLEPELYAEVGNGTLTVQKNSTTIGTFTANQKTDTTIDITVPVATSELTNDANFQNANDVASAISQHNQSTSAHQDIRQAITDEQTARINADNGLQGQIDAITAASDVVDIVGTYAELQAYNTQHLKDNDVVKVLQDETHNDAMTYYRWSTHTETWTYIGAEGPYYTKSETNTLLDDKLDKSAVPDGFFDGAATVNPTPATSVEVQDCIKLKSVELQGDTVQGANPTPSSPQTIQTVTGEQNILVAGKNLFSTAFSADFTATNNNTFTLHRTDLRVTRFWFPYDLPAGTYTLSLKIAASTAPQGLNLNFFDANSQQITTISTIKTTPYSATITLSQPLNMIDAFIQTGDAANSYITIEDFQIEQGETPTDFAPYQGMQSYTVDLGATELCKIGDYQDYIYKSGDDWYLHKETTKAVFDGTENWNYGSISSFYRGSLTFSDWKPSQQNFYNSHFIAGNTGNIPNVCGIGSTQVFMSMDASLGVTTKAQWLTWLSNNNVTMYTILATPTDTQITDDTLLGQLEAFLKATIYQPTTTITASGTLPAILNVEAFTDNLNSLLEIASQPDPEQTTYSDFVGTDGVSAGTAGLVPAPATTDAGKFLKADGTWDTAGGGSSVTVVQTTGTSQTDVMSQNAVGSMVFADPGTDTKIKIGASASVSAQSNNMAIGPSAGANGTQCLAIGPSAGARGNGVALGYSAKAGNATAHSMATALGNTAHAYNKGTVALGAYSTASSVGEVNIGSSDTSYGYNSSNYRLLSGVYDGQNANDAVNVGQINATIDAINAALSTSIPHIGA